MPTIVKQHLPAFKGDAPKDWVPGSCFRFKSSQSTSKSSFSKWYTEGSSNDGGVIQKAFWLPDLLYEYEVEDKKPIATYVPKFDGDCPPDYEVGCKTWSKYCDCPTRYSKDPNWYKGEAYKYHPKESQTVVKPEKFWIVWRPGSRGSNPRHRHFTEQMAKQEADRLSKANPNIEFIVLESKSCSKSTAHVTTESQEYE